MDHCGLEGTALPRAGSSNAQRDTWSAFCTSYNSFTLNLQGEKIII